MDMKYTKKDVQCIKLRNLGPGGYEWADIYLDQPETEGNSGFQGRILIASGYGIWGHYWDAMGKPLIQFLVGCDIHYLMGKLGKRDWFDLEATQKALREIIKDCGMEDHAIVQCELELANLDNCSQYQEWIMEILNSPALNALEWHSYIEMDHTPELRGFIKDVWPSVVAAFHDELKEVTV